MKPEQLNLNLNQLEKLSWILHAGSTAAASRQYGIAQSALHASLKEMRREFKDELLEGRGASVRLTPFARQLQPKLVDLMQHIAEILTAQHDGESFRVMASDYVTDQILWRLVGNLPKVQLDITPLTHNPLRQLLEGSTDLVIMPDALEGEDATSVHNRPLWRDQWVLVGSPSVDFTGIGPDADLARWPYLAYRHESLGRSLADVALDQIGIRRHPAVISAPSWLQIAHTVAESDDEVISVIHSRTAHAVAQHTPLTTHRLPVELPTIRETLYWAPRHDRDREHTVLREHLITTARRI